VLQFLSLIQNKHKSISCKNLSYCRRPHWGCTGPRGGHDVLRRRHSTRFFPHLDGLCTAPSLGHVGACV